MQLFLLRCIHIITTPFIVKLLTGSRQPQLVNKTTTQRLFLGSLLLFLLLFILPQLIFDIKLTTVIQWLLYIDIELKRVFIIIIPLQLVLLIDPRFTGKEPSFMTSCILLYRDVLSLEQTVISRIHYN